MVDVDGVLVSGRPSDGRHWATSLEADLGLSFELLKNGFFNPYWDEIVTGRADIRERLTAALLRIAPELGAADVLTYWFRQDARLDRDLLNDLATFRSDGLRIYLATNQEHERARYLMDVLELSAHVDGCFHSAAIGHRKPAAAFFEIAASQTRLHPSELLLIDDAEENVRAARQSGWQALHWSGRVRLPDLVAQVPAVYSGGNPYMRS